MSANYLEKIKKSIEVLQPFSVIFPLIFSSVGILIIKKYLDGVGLSDNFIYVLGSPSIIAVIAAYSILFVFSVVVIMALMPMVMITFEIQTNRIWGDFPTISGKKVVYNTFINLLGMISLVAIFKFLDKPPVIIYFIIALLITFFLLIPYKNNPENPNNNLGDLIVYSLVVFLGVCFGIYPLLFLFKIALLIEVESLQWVILFLMVIAYCLFSAIVYSGGANKRVENLIIFCTLSLFSSLFLLSADTINNIAKKTGLGMYEDTVYLNQEYIKELGGDFTKEGPYHLYVKLNSTNELWAKVGDNDAHLYKIPKDKIIGKNINNK
ncbi:MULTISPECIES: hypothetical protein [Acinetobacter]|uniref:hypothetical protein n=1 Tax=Acinetobacter TaxID=469 RepID=UPI00147913F8|nr:MULTISPECIES: hypothetical protein [Acinetobacter]MDQ9949992.1 hypothetical protein [Acinetobacter sp. 12966]